MIAEFSGGAFEELAGLIDDQRRQRVVAAARSFERVTSIHLASLQIPCFTGHAKFVFRAIVKRFEIRIRQWPIRQGATFRYRCGAIACDGLRACTKIILMEPPDRKSVV